MQRVGSGECWALAHEALKDAGAQSSTTTRKNDDYVWGTLVSVQMVIPGDILQFRNYAAITMIKTDVTFDDGSGYEDTNESTLQRPHHTAIVAENKGATGLLVLEQNVAPGGRTVQQNLLPITGTGPEVKTDFQSMKDNAGKMRRAKVVMTTTTTISGRILAYRPQKKP
jgi:hypothetical protein